MYHSLFPSFVQWRDIPVIVLTSNEEEDVGSEMLVLGAEDTLRKPMSDATLYVRINKVRRPRWGVHAGLLLSLTPES